MAKRNVAKDPFGIASSEKAYKKRKEDLFKKRKEKKKRKNVPSVPRSKSGRVG